MSIIDLINENTRLQTKLAEKGRAFDEVLLMQGAEISALQELVAIQYRANEDMTKELQSAEAEAERSRDGLLLEMSQIFLAAWDRAEGGRGCYSCTEVHDSRCEKGREISNNCTCGRDVLEAASELLRAALRGEGEKP